MYFLLNHLCSFTHDPPIFVKAFLLLASVDAKCTETAYSNKVKISFCAVSKIKVGTTVYSKYPDGKTHIILLLKKLILRRYGHIVNT